MSKNVRIIGCLITLSTLIVSILLIYYREQDKAERLVDASEYIVATHYFADEWPANFWNSEWNNIDEDFEQIKRDGFNTIIVVVPWREFQPTISPVSYNEYVFSKMNMLFQKAKEHDLQVQLRVGYLHDFYSDEDAAQRFYDIVYNEDTKNAWMDYVRKVYVVASQYDNFIGGFITWEDFWHNYALVDYVGGTELADTYPTRAEFVDYIKNEYVLDEFNEKYKSEFCTYDEIPIPKRDDLYAEVWFAFIDDFTMNLLSSSREFFPDLNMEVRTDKDPIGTSKGKNKKYSHKRTWNCAGADYMTIMYQPLQGNLGSSKGVSAKAAVQNLENWLQNIYDNNGNVPIYIDQFLYYDNTPTNDDGDIIKTDELGKYIVLCSDVFKKYTKGYGVWTYRDYYANMLYNPQFALEDSRWQHNDKIIIEYDVNVGSYICNLKTDGYIMQKLPAIRNLYDSEEYKLVFDVLSIVKEGVLRISMGSQIQEYNFSEIGRIELTFEKNESFNVKIQVINGECVIDNIKLYSHMQKGYLYSSDNQILECIKDIHKINYHLR